MIRTIILVAAIVAQTQADPWAVVIAGSNTWGNYRHQADACHVYQNLVNGGVPESNIIMFYYDDLANNSYNPFPGQVFNRPSAGLGYDVYHNCKKSYTGADVTTVNFLNVLTGNASAMRGIGSGEVLNTTANDTIFVSYHDHGAEGLLGMPTGDYLYADQLQNAFNYMYKNNRYSRMVF